MVDSPFAHATLTLMGGNSWSTGKAAFEARSWPEARASDSIVRADSLTRVQQYQSCALMHRLSTTPRQHGYDGRSFELKDLG